MSEGKGQAAWQDRARWRASKIQRLAMRKGVFARGKLDQSARLAKIKSGPFSVKLPVLIQSRMFSEPCSRMRAAVDCMFGTQTTALTVCGTNIATSQKKRRGFPRLQTRSSTASLSPVRFVDCDDATCYGILLRRAVAPAEMTSSVALADVTLLPASVCSAPVAIVFA